MACWFCTASGADAERRRNHCTGERRLTDRSRERNHRSVLFSAFATRTRLCGTRRTAISSRPYSCSR
jgi:hypothetical protein